MLASQKTQTSEKQRWSQSGRMSQTGTISILWWRKHVDVSAMEEDFSPSEIKS